MTKQLRELIEGAELTEETIKVILAIQALEVLGSGFLKHYTLDDALDGAKRVSKAQLQAVLMAID